MRVLCISDTHGRPPAPQTLPPADILIHAGDATMRGSADEWADFKAWLADCPHTHKVFLPGNHDMHCPTYLGPNVQIAHDTLIEIGGVTMWGWSGSAWHDEGEPVTRPGPRSWAHWCTDEEQAAGLARMPEGLDILITHTPPLGILDRTARGPRVGCALLTKRLAEMAFPPRCHVFGHIHEGGGGHLISGPTWHLNAAWLTERYSRRAIKTAFVLTYADGLWSPNQWLLR